jgi:eukaryotic-like serine/threonine-protein kinase
MRAREQRRRSPRPARPRARDAAHPGASAGSAAQAVRSRAAGGISPPTLAPGEMLAPGYEVLAHLNRGSRLDVYDAWSEERRCRCIAKVLRPERRTDRSARRGLIAEGRLLLEFSHPHIVRAYELVERPQPVLILETLTGETLAHLIERRSRRLAAIDLAHLGLQLCSAIGYLHRHGVLHLDLKPSNIVSECGQAKILDLSIARRPGPGHAGEGTPAYMAPEQARGGSLTAATDVWGIGVVLFEAGSAQCPFDTPGATSEYEQLEHPAPPLRTLRRLPPALAEAIEGCLEPDANRRPSLDQLRRALSRLV